MSSTVNPPYQTGDVKSIKDARVVEARLLASAVGRKQSGKCLLPGEEIINWALQAGLSLENVFFSEKAVCQTFLEKLQSLHIPCLSTSDGILKKIAGTHYTIPLLGVARIPQIPFDATAQFVLVLDGLQDQGNIGSIIRTAHGFGIRDVLSTHDEFDLFYKKTIDASRGTLFETHHLSAHSPGEAVHFLKENGYQIVTTSSHANQVQSLTRLQERPLALVIGNESNGVSEEFIEGADLVVQIPMSSTLESLNVSVAAGISIYEYKYKMVMTMLIHNIRATLGREINVTGKLIQQALDQHLKEMTTINSTQLILLMVMKCDRQMTTTQISKDTACYGEELQLLLESLLDDNLISKHTFESELAYNLTPTGEALLASLWNAIESSEAKLLRGFDENEIRQLRDYLQRLQHNAIELIS